ncbi:auxin response factor 18 [Cajanus cajan]|uniref:auxin response factor 18 n=1 Tax=Cajanus cajan TaxID=3821 RepID=UPI00098D9433|nr:auxin response factor 18 [Cajanus cajan]XP_020212415.1 auxin response factor 18 [Cajanus cajan]XP_020212416.1 auxin response factor 18 [Cajanus cajan]XP_029126843.1 auxin response factor 18 [Cajanus cajan]XP_029126844.1 auxin response factor 18 [Cajanus cajan]XP_029126845.1 auxin response factor 18 [Cajanus cajan]XP_029126846.1 auxin response factor 18 [Cajanus cajan]
MLESKEKLKEVDMCLDHELWHACAGGMVQMPVVNAKVFYFPQGHAEHACGPVDFRAYPKIPPFIQCRVGAIKYMADPETDEVYAKMRLVPLSSKEVDFDDDGGVGGGINGSQTKDRDKPPSFAKTLTQSDANNGGGFSVPRYCAETIFPRLDYSAEPPYQNIFARDVHGETWKFRHIYRGTPRRHLLTTGWSTFVNQKKLVAGDSIVFLRAENGDLCVGIRRAKRGIGGGFETPSVWNSARGIRPMPFGGFSAFLREEDNQLMRNGNSNGNGLSLSPGAKGKVRPEAVIEAATLAANLQDFEVVYYPRASTPEFCVKASLVRAAFQIRWCPGMRFKMPFETEDSSRISWFLGTISSVNFADPRWPDSPWRLLQVTWDEPELLQNVKRVSPWLVEIVSNMPAIHLSPFSPPRKKLRLPQHPEFAFEGQIPFPTFPSNFLGPTNPFGYPPESTTPAGMQGARHDNYGISLPNFHLNNKLHSGLFQSGFPPLDHAASPTLRVSNTPPLQKANTSDNVSCLLSMSTSSQSSKKVNDVKAPHLVLFGQTILTEQQISLSTSADTVSPGKSSPDGNVDKMTNFSDGSGFDLHKQRSSCEVFHWYKDHHHKETVASLETGHCKVFMESEDVGRTMDLSLLGSYDELYRKMADMFGIEKSVVLSHVLYCDITGAVKHIGDEAFSDFTKSARRLTIIMDSSRDNRGI